MVCHGILDKRICETSSDAIGACVWSGSESSGFCAGEQDDASPEPKTMEEPASPAPEPYDLTVMLPMYLWTALATIAMIVVFLLLLRAERNRPSGPHPDKGTLKAAMRSR